MKRFFCILLTMILIGSLLIIPVSASSVYLHYISPGDYVFNDTLSRDFFTNEIVDFSYRCNGVDYQGFRFHNANDRAIYFIDVSLPASSNVMVYENGNWVSSAYRTITVMSGNYVDSRFYSWFVSNSVRVDGNYSSSFFDSLLTCFYSVGEWISGAVNNLTSMFWVDGSLTFYGVLCIAALSISVIFLLIGFISIFLRFRG